jgi:hypothetical protein
MRAASSSHPAEAGTDVGQEPGPDEPRMADRTRLRSTPHLRSLAQLDRLPLIVSTWLAGTLVALVASTPYRGDDLINKGIREIVATAGTTLPGFTRDITEQWMRNEGRFFPGSLSWTYSMFWLFDNRVAYKLAIGLVLVVAIAGYATFAARLTGHWRAAAVFVPIVCATIQFRTTFDGIISFAALLPLTALLTIAAVLLLVTRRGAWWATLAAVSYMLALVTYETVILFAPIMVAIVIWSRRSWRPAVAIVVPVAIQLAIVLSLRTAMAAPPNPAYTINLDPASVLETFAKQALAAVPMSQWLFGAPTMPPIPAGSLLIGALTVGVPTFLSIVHLNRTRIRAAAGPIAAIAAFGAWIWLSSAALVSVTVRWQLDLQRGQGYLAVVYGYFGLALCLLAAYLVLERVVADRAPATIAVWRYGSALLIAIVISLTFAGNVAVAAV